MASECDEFESEIENLKFTVRKSFAILYATLKARELKTLRQLDAIRKQCQSDRDLQRNCVQNIHISYDNESTLLDNINNYGAIELERLNFDSDIFAIEDYVCPNEDHMYSYKCIEDLTKTEDDLSEIEEVALKQITSTNDCVCFVNIRADEVSHKFREVSSRVGAKSESSELVEDVVQSTDSPETLADEKSDCSDPSVKKIDPTDDWLNSIKNQTETEPTQISDVMEHSGIACS